VTPAALAELLREVASDVLAGRGLDVDALPSVVLVERPRNPEHGDYATNLALQSARRAGVAPRELAGWLARTGVAYEEPDDLADAVADGSGWLAGSGSAPSGVDRVMNGVSISRKPCAER